MMHGTVSLKYTDKYFPLENMLPGIVFQISTSLHGLLLVLSLNFLLTMNDICWKNSTFVHIIYTHTHTHTHFFSNSVIKIMCGLSFLKMSLICRK